MGIAEAKKAAAASSAPEPAEQLQPDGAGSPEPAPEPNYYCQAKGHSTALVTRERLFYWPGEVDEAGALVMLDLGNGVQVPDQRHAPVCPACSATAPPDPLTGKPRQVRVIATPVEYDEGGHAVIPAAILSVATRAGEGW